MIALTCRTTFFPGERRSGFVRDVLRERVMKFRSVLSITTVLGGALMSSVAWAGGCYGEACYRHVVQPPVYGVISEKVMLQAPQVYARAIPGEYAAVSEKVLIAPPRKVWQVTRGPYGEALGCWVTAPAQYALQHRR